MKILILNEHHRISPRVQMEIDALSERHEVSVLAWNRSDGPVESDDRSTYVHVPAIEGRLTLLAYLPLVYWRFLVALFDREYDVVHCTHFMLLPLAVLVGLIRDTRVVYDVYERHTIEISYYFPASTVVRQLLEVVENELCKLVDLVLTVDAPNDLLAERYRSVNDNIEVLYNVPEVDDELPQPTDSLRADYGDDDVLIYVGGISIAKGVLQMVQALDELRDERPDIRLLLVGTFKSGREQTFEFVDRRDLGDSVEHIEWVPYDEMMSYLAVADIGLALHQPDRKFQYVSTGTGRKFFTYMEAGLPIVGPEYEDVGAVVRETECGVLVDSTDTTAIVDAIEQLLDNPEDAREIGTRGREALEQRYNWANEKQKLFAGYERMSADH